MDQNTIRTLVSHIPQNTDTEHLVFIYQTSVYILVRSRRKKNKEIYYAIQNRFKTYEEAKAFKNGYIAARTFFAIKNTISTFMEDVELSGYTLQEYT